MLNYCGYILSNFWENLGTCLIPHLVTLLTTKFEVAFCRFCFLEMKVEICFSIFAKYFKERVQSFF